VVNQAMIITVTDHEIKTKLKIQGKKKTVYYN